MINEDTIFYIDEITGEKKIYEGEWKKLQSLARKQYDTSNITIVKEDNFLRVYKKMST